MNPTNEQPAWFRLQANLPYVGVQHAGWLWTEPYKASLLQASLQTCPGAPLRVVTQDGNPVAAATQIPGMTMPTIPGWPSAA